MDDAFCKMSETEKGFTLAIILSQFEHCAQVWRLYSDTQNEKLKMIQTQRQEVKWIPSEKNHSYHTL